MNKAILYTTNCPKCNILKQRLTDSNIQFEIINDIDKLLEMGIMTAPILEVDNQFLTFTDAIKWIETIKENIND